MSNSLKRFFFTFITRRTLLLVASDCIALLGTVILSAYIRNIFDPVEFSQHWILLLFLLVAICINFIEELYDATPPPLPEELKSLTFSISLAYFCIAIYLFFFRADLPSRLVFVASWMASLFILPLLRCKVREHFSKKSWWGIPAIFFGDGKIFVHVQEYLTKHPEFGLTPFGYACFFDQTITPQKDCNSMNKPFQYFYTEEAVKTFVQRYPTSCAFVLISKSNACHADIERMSTSLFSSIILISEEFFNCSIPLWVRPLEIGSMLCLKVQQNLLDPRKLAIKRCMDLFLSIIIGIVILPFILFIAILIRLESPGPIFFKQLRVGRQGKPIWILKFRTMIQDAEVVLQKTLLENDELRKEWELDQKLRYDPRITRVGKFLRRTSLDELPQLWNVLCGDMSLVGPRPIIKEEIVRYDEAYLLYIRVRPGITGLWQVSGRNDLTYEQRVKADWYYISNWSVWLDLLILARTIPVVLQSKGAY